ncbi:MAG TPA: carboxypeptidase-like regulatory domain-containing protein [Pelobium sp.]
MNSPQNDIELIRKYHNGELSSAEKNQLEARALDDAFLQDALDGYEAKDLKPNELLALSKRLEERIAPAKILTPVWGFKQWGIAASILLCIALASIYFNQAPNNKTIALTDVQQKEDIPQTQRQKLAPAESEDSDQNALAGKIDETPQIANPVASTTQNNRYAPDADILVEPVAPEGAATNNSPTALAEVNVNGYGTQKKQDLTGAVSQMAPESLMASRMMRAEKQRMASSQVKGTITDQTNNTPLPGVSIKNLSTGQTEQTDINGEFSIDAQKDDNLAITYLGYDTKNKTVEQPSDSLNVQLTPANASLSEVVVVGYGKAAKNANEIAAPKVGWKLFKQYLENQAKIANVGKGKVELQFVIDSQGELSDFRIVKSFSEKAAVAAINIIKNYNGGWLASAEKIPHKATIIIKFK